jgi:SnoaL-like domain
MKKKGLTAMKLTKKLDGLNNSAPTEPAVQAVLQALSQGQVGKAVNRFSDHFTFTDNGLGLEFTDKVRLQEFFNKTRELYPELSIVPIAVFRSGDHEVCEWILQNTVTESAFGNLQRKVPVSLTGVSIARVEHGGITRWADYYDGLKARRTALGAYFTEWIEL